MKAILPKITLISLLFLLQTGCKKNYIISDKQEVLFQFDYVNYAWGFQHHGFMIDNNGNVLTYNNPDTWNFPDNNLGISSDQLRENINKCSHTDIKIDRDELQKYANYINNIASSRVTALKNVAADAGSGEYICYQFAESSSLYKGSLIKREGDFTCENLNFYSKKVAVWLKEINNSIPAW